MADVMCSSWLIFDSIDLERETCIKSARLYSLHVLDNDCNNR
jgi:hypothetical protein